MNGHRLQSEADDTISHFGKAGKPEKVISKITQEALAEMVGTTRGRVSFFMNRFRRLGTSSTTAN
jgi:CRP-like cAMP-binding protein